MSGNESAKYLVAGLAFFVVLVALIGLFVATMDSEENSSAEVAELDIAGQGDLADVDTFELSTGELQPVDGEVPVKVDVTNSGSADDDIEVSLEYDGDTQTQEVLVPEGGTQTVTFDLWSDQDTLESGESEVVVTAGDQEVTGTVTVNEPSPAEVSLSNLDIADQGDSSNVTVGNNRNVEVGVENVGGVSGSFTVELVATQTVENNGGQQTVTVREAEATVQVGGQQSESIVFSDFTSDMEVGEYQMTASAGDEEMTGTLTVEEPEPAEAALSDLDLGSQGSEATVTEGDNANVDVTVENVGEVEGTFSPTLMIGDNEFTRTVDVSGESSRTVTFTGAFTSLEEGEYDVTVEVGGFDGSEVSGSLTVEQFIAPAEAELSDLTIAGQGDDAGVVVGENHHLEVDVENVGDTEGIFTVSATVGDTEYTQNVSLVDGQSERVVFTGVTLGLETGDYDVTVQTNEDNQVTGSLSVVENPAESSLSNLEVAGQGDSATILNGLADNTDVTVDVENVGDLDGTFDVNLYLGSEVFTNTVDVSVNSSQTVTFEGALEAVGVGGYTFDVLTDDDSVSGDLTVEEPEDFAGSLSGLDVAGQGDSATVTEGTQNTLEVAVTNSGDESGTAQVEFYLDDSNTSLQSVTTSELAGGESETVSFDLFTSQQWENVESGEHTVTVETASDSVSGDLTVDALAEPALSNLNIAGQGDSATVFTTENGNVAVDVENVGDLDGTFDVTLTLNGTDSTQSVDVNASATETVTFEDMTGSLNTGDYTVEVSSGESSVSGNLTIEEPDPAESRLTNLDIGGQGDVATILAGEEGDISLTVENVGDFDGQFTVDWVGLGQSKTVDVPAQSSGVVTFNDVLSQAPPGEVTLVFETQDDQTSGLLNVQQPPTADLSGLDVANQGSNATITVGDNENVVVNLGNVGDVSGEFDVSLEIGNQDSLVREDVEVGSGGGVQVVFEDVTGGLSTGQYNVDVMASNQYTQDTVTGTLNIDPEPAEASLSSLDIDDQGSSATINQGEDAVFAAILNNVGGQDGTFQVDIEIEDSNDNVVESASSQEMVSEGGQTTVTFSGLSNGLATGDYDVVITAGSDSVSGSLTVQ